MGLFSLSALNRASNEMLALRRPANEVTFVPRALKVLFKNKTKIKNQVAPLFVCRFIDDPPSDLPGINNEWSLIITQLNRRFSHVPYLIREVSALRWDV